jgi:hypothetical protein
MLGGCGERDAEAFTEELTRVRARIGEAFDPEARVERSHDRRDF